MSIGNRIKAARLRQKLTQNQLAKKMNISQSAVAQFEKGNNAKYHTVEKIASAMGLSVTELLNYENITEPITAYIYSTIEDLPEHERIAILSQMEKKTNTVYDYEFRDIPNGEAANLEITKKFFQQKMDQELLSNYNKVNLEGKKKIIEYSGDIAANPKYIDETTDSEE